jgi:hypothetical protein
MMTNARRQRLCRFALTGPLRIATYANVVTMREEVLMHESIDAHAPLDIDLQHNVPLPLTVPTHPMELAMHARVC